MTVKPYRCLISTGDLAAADRLARDYPLPIPSMKQLEGISPS
jgi:hypothetical protein